MSSTSKEDANTLQAAGSTSKNDKMPLATSSTFKGPNTPQVTGSTPKEPTKPQVAPSILKGTKTPQSTGSTVKNVKTVTGPTSKSADQKQGAGSASKSIKTLQKATLSPFKAANLSEAAVLPTKKDALQAMVLPFTTGENTPHATLLPSKAADTSEVEVLPTKKINAAQATVIPSKAADTSEVEVLPIKKANTSQAKVILTKNEITSQAIVIPSNDENAPPIKGSPTKTASVIQPIVPIPTPRRPKSVSKDAGLQIGMIITHKVGRWKVQRNIASGPFSEVFVVVDVDNKKAKYAMKCERQEGNQRPVLKLDVLVLMSVKGSVGFPLFIAAGRTKIYRYCVMQLVGPDLGKLRRSLVAKRFSVPTALRVLQQTLRRLEVLHDAGWLCRDVKAPNFAIGLGHESGIIYMLDFGFARKYKDANGVVYPPREAAALLGTFQYTSLASHCHRDQAPKDDLESWFYMAAELLKGPLPWSKIDGHKEHRMIMVRKMYIRAEGRADFIAGMPTEFDHILSMIDQMNFFDRPQYQVIQSLIDQAAEKLGFTLHEPLDWQMNARVLRKAEFVGELGESNLASMKMDEEGDTSSEYSLDKTPLDIELPANIELKMNN